jgi:hypothetical protein
MTFVKHLIFCLCFSLYGCVGAGVGDPLPYPTAQPASLPQIPVAPVTSLTLNKRASSLLIARQPLSTAGSDPLSLYYSQQVFQLVRADPLVLNDIDKLIPVPLMGTATETLDLTGNLSLLDKQQVIPTDLMPLNDQYWLLALSYRDLDKDETNNNFNLLIDLSTGTAYSAPLGLNPQGNSGELPQGAQMRDYFPPDNRFNDTADLYVLDVDYALLAQYPDGIVDTDPEPVDHVNPITDTSTDTASTSTTTTPTTTATPSTTATTTTSSTNTSSDTSTAEKVIPTALYRMRVSDAGAYTLDKISAPGDRPGLGQFAASRAGVLIYRNLDAGDDAYRVLISGCDEVTGRVSARLYLPNSTLMVADDSDGNSAIFEVTERGINKLIFNCNGTLTRLAYSGYTQKVSSLRMGQNSTATGPYRYDNGYLASNRCETLELFPQKDPQTTVQNPMPSVPGLGSDYRSLRRLQNLGQQFVCLGYNASGWPRVYGLNHSVKGSEYLQLPYNIDNWVINFDSFFMLDNGQLLFSGYPRTGYQTTTQLLDAQGNYQDVSDTLGGIIPMQLWALPTPTTP